MSNLAKECRKVKKELDHVIREFKYYANDLRDTLNEYFCPEQRSHCVRANDGRPSCCQDDFRNCPVAKYRTPDT